MKISKGWMAAIIIALVIIVDQVLKIWVKTSFYYGEELPVTDWFRLFFIENNGMAFGLELLDKVVLTLFRLIMSGVFIYYIYRNRKENYPRGFFACIALITAGTIGNTIDCMFYGLLFDAPMYPEVATFLPEGGGYASLFYGRVVDMLYFPLVEWYWPEWMPFVGGDYFQFFQPVFNIADYALCVGVFIIILFYTKSLSESLSSKPKVEEPDSDNE